MTFQVNCAMSTEHKRLHILISAEQLKWLDKKANSFVSRASIIRSLINRAMENDP